MADRNPLVQKLRAEYDRLGVEPTEAGVSYLHDENGMPKLNPQKQRHATPPVQEFSNMPEPIRAEKVQPPPVASPVLARGPNPTIPAHVGVHEETMWFDEHVVGPQQSAPQQQRQQIIDNNEEMDVDALQGRRPLGEESQMPGWAKTAAEANTAAEPKQGPPEQRSEKSLGFLEHIGASMRGGKFLLLVEGEPVVVRSNKKELKAVIEDVLLRHNVGIEKVQVLKDVPIDFGVLMED